MPETIQTSTLQTASVPNHRVHTADSLRGPWTIQPALRCNRIRRACLPEIETAELWGYYGNQVLPGQRKVEKIEPFDLNGKIVRITIGIPENGEPDFADDEKIVWYGVLESDEKEPDGDLGEEIATGHCTLLAYGLGRLFERTIIESARVRVGSDTQVIGRGLSFNIEPPQDDEPITRSKGFRERGNRTSIAVATDADNVPHYEFSDAPRGAEIWTAAEAVRYILRHHSPKTSRLDDIEVLVEFEDEDLVACKLDDPDGVLSWYDTTVATDGRNVFEVLCDLVDRRRGVGGYLDYDYDKKTIFLRVFTPFNTPIILESGVTVPANANARELDFDQSYDVKARTRKTLASEFHTIRVVGAFRTSTTTLRLDPTHNELVKDWTSTEEAAYLAGAEAMAGYSVLDFERQGIANAAERDSDRLRAVFCRFKISPTWTQRTNLELVDYFVAPLLGDDGEPRQPYHVDDEPLGEPWWNRGIIIERHLALKDRYDYTGDKIETDSVASLFAAAQTEPEWLPPLAMANIDGKWRELHKLASATAQSAVTPRRWSVATQICDQSAAIELRVQGAPQHVIASNKMTGAAYTDPDHTAAHLHGIEYENIHVTLTLRLDSRVIAEKTLSAPGEGQQRRTKWIHIPDARLDYVVPETYVRIVEGAVQSSDGGFVRDDRTRLKDIARMAAEWYGLPRQSLELAFAQIRPLFQLGWLLTRIGPAAGTSGRDVNAPVTAIVYDLNQQIPRTTVETSYAELDFSTVRR